MQMMNEGDFYFIIVVDDGQRQGNLTSSLNCSFIHYT